MYDMSGFNYDITDVVHLLQLRVRHKNSSSMDVNCPFCGETKGKMNVNLQKNVFRCNRCDASGGMLELYGRLHGVSSAEANRQIREALGKGEYRTNYQVAPKKEPVEIINAELADADVIDRTYQEMLSLLTLNDKHQEDLKKRGLTEEQIEIQRYRSVPLFGIKNMVQKLLESGQTVKGVPGFYEDQDGKWTINFSSKNSGILIPIQSPEGKIQGFQIRLDQVMEGRKYIWLSSVKFKNGVSSGSPVHVMYSNYQPLTLDEWIACDKNRKQKSCQNVKRYEKEPSKTGRLKVFIVVYDFLGMSTVPSVSIKDRIASEFC